METMFHNIMAIELLVRDLTKCTAFYRDTLGLEVRESESTADSVSFQMGNVYFFPACGKRGRADGQFGAA
jgi:catechol 2,3-dioxygenase-like lactoylglutathione lyase family enzyme